MIMERWWNEIDKGKPNFRCKSCPIVTLSNKIATWAGLELNLFVRAERLATNCLNYDMAPVLFNFYKDL
jgi:hypothetical protein